MRGLLGSMATRLHRWLLTGRLLRSAGWVGILLATQVALAAPGPAAAPDAALVKIGEAIYLKGQLPSGAPLQGIRRGGGQNLAGSAAACVNCHRHSGLGAPESSYWIPPITGSFLFHSSAARLGDRGLPYAPGQRLDRPGYDEQSLGRVLREGVDPGGKSLGYLMPRFALNDADVHALIAYLKTLTPQDVPGVEATLLHFATIITPDADPIKRQGVLDVLKAFFAEKNTFPFPPSPPMLASGKGGAAKGMYMANRHWQLHVWQLEGPASTWPAQLDAFLRKEPVMAVISGLEGDNWAPVHAFCERARLPCLFPNAEVPVVAENDFYSLYFSKGVLLEAELIAHRIGAQSGLALNAPVAQVYRAGDSGEAAAQALSTALQESGTLTRNVVIPAAAPAEAVRQAVLSASGAAAIVLWLRPGDLQALEGVAPPPETVYASGLMGGLDDTPLPKSWRAQAWLAYPFDLPASRLVRLRYPLSWFKIRQIPVVAQQVQVDTYLACGLINETIDHLSDNFGREYLVERLEEMLSHRLLTGYYPHLSLAEGQKFASKGGYLLHLPTESGANPSPDGVWVVP